MQPKDSIPAVAIYARVSTEDQAERQTIQAQIDFLRKYCDLHHLPVAGAYLDDGISGTMPLDQRPAGRRLVDDAGAGRFGAVIVYRVDRLARKLTVLIGAYEALDRLGVALRSGTEPIDTATPIGRMLFHLLGVFAEFEKDSFRERATLGRDRVAQHGKYTGGPIPFGYDLGDDGRLIASARTTATAGGRCRSHHRTDAATRFVFPVPHGRRAPRLPVGDGGRDHALLFSRSNLSNGRRAGRSRGARAQGRPARRHHSMANHPPKKAARRTPAPAAAGPAPSPFCWKANGARSRRTCRRQPRWSRSCMASSGG